jgi:hypothetical protein
MTHLVTKRGGTGVERQRVTIKEAAKILGISEQYVRLGLQSGELPFGTAVKMSSIYTYHISPKLFKEYIGG